MFSHLLKLIWKRKARNIMLSLEILLAFLIVFAIAAAGLRYLQVARLPTGFDHQDVWAVTLLPPLDANTTFTPDLYGHFKRGLATLPEVRGVAFSNSAPFNSSSMSGDFKLPGNGRRFNSEMLEVNDDFFSVLGIKAARGRLFDSSDDGAAVQPTVINRRLAHELFGTDAAVGLRYIAGNNAEGEPAQFQVVGVIDELRMNGELASPRNVMVMRHIPFQTSISMQSILIKMAPGTPRAFEEQLTTRLKQIRSDWGYVIAPLSALQVSARATMVTPLSVVAVIAAFLLAMVAVGLFGVLWQNTARRIPEIGLRRAVGASAGAIYRQIIAEQVLLSSGAILVGMLLLVQLPITGVFGERLNWAVFCAAAALSMAVIYLLSLLCAMYPAWRASRLSPTEALHND
jgi:putative ABC transport system permease protein